MRDQTAEAIPAYRLEGVENFRDFGVFPGRHGQGRPGRLFRSAHHADATPADLQRLQALGIATVVDLRRPSERQRQPSRRPVSFAGRVIAADDGDRAEAPHIEFLRQGDLSDAGVERFLLDYYRKAPFEARHLGLFAQAFKALDECDGALLVHCTAGKDRTGLLAALILSTLGASEEDILHDYLETNRVMLAEDRIASALPVLRAMVGGEPSEAIVHGLLGVRESHLNAAFVAIEQDGGGMEAYLRRLGVESGRLDRLRARLLA